jgi:two-component system, cell cycle response regulator DivK
VKRIAVVEDNPDNRLLVRALLADAYDIDEYETGILALEQLPNNVPSLVLLDISLPGMDGTEVLAALRENATLKELPVVALTAHAMSGDRERFLQMGFDDYFTKPIVDDEAFLALVARYVERST